MRTVGSTGGRVWKLMAAAIGANTIAYLGWYSLPQQWATLSGLLGQNQADTSLIVSAEVLTAAVVSIVMSFVIGSRAPKQVLIGGALLIVAGHAYATVANGFLELLVSRLVAGVGEGLLWLMLNAALADLEDPDRRYAYVNAATSLALSIMIAGVPYLENLHGVRTIFYALVAVALLFSPTLMPYLFQKAPARQRDGDGDVQHSNAPALASWRGWLLAVGVVVWAMAVTVTYSLSAEIGRNTGAPDKSVYASIALSLMGIVAGSFMAGVIGTRFGRAATLAAILILEAVAAFVLVEWTTLTGFTVGMVVVNFAAYCAFPYMLGLAAELDRSGGCAAAVAGAFALGAGVAPMFGAYLVAQTGGYVAVAWAIVLASLFLFAAVLVLQRRNATASVLAAQ